MSAAPLADRVAVVTGAGRGIGRAHALRLAAHGARVVVNDAGVGTDGSPTDERPADEVVGEVVDGGGRAVAHHGDVSSTAVGRELVELALDTWGRLDVVICNAGIGRPRMVFNLDDDEWDDVVRVHLRGTFSVARHACRHWRSEAKATGSSYGRLLDTSSGLLLLGGAGQSNYVAAKAGIAAFTEAVATEMAPYGVTANTIMPGAMTRLAAIGWRMERDRPADDAFDPTSPVHVAELACYLASPAAGWISGQTFQVAGARIEHVTSWHVEEVLERHDAGFTAADLATELPRLFGAGPRRPDPPPTAWHREHASHRARGAPVPDADGRPAQGPPP